MSRPLEEIVFQTRALAQGHPLTEGAQAYLNETVAHERTTQPVDEIGVWAGYALTAGYCLRRFEEEDTGHRAPSEARSATTAELDSLSSEVADRIRSDDPGELFFYPEHLVIDALDHIIGGEVERRLSHWEETVDEETYEELESYIAWWTVKGYALRIAEQLVGAGGRA